MANDGGNAHGKTSAVQQIAAREEAKARAAKIAELREDLAKEMGSRKPSMARIDGLKFALRALGAR